MGDSFTNADREKKIAEVVGVLSDVSCNELDAILDGAKLKLHELACRKYYAEEQRGRDRRGRSKQSPEFPLAHLEATRRFAEEQRGRDRYDRPKQDLGFASEDPL